ncbi:MAG: DUF2164 domain-containing protein [Lachnospiraceae bacterium]
MRRSAPLKMSDKQREQLKEEIKAFYLDVRGDAIGIIEQEQLLSLFMERLAPIVYNKALDDAQYWYQKQLENMESDFFSLYRDF